MIKPIILGLAACFFAVAAYAKDEVEYLLPENWESEQVKPQKRETLDFDRVELRKRFNLAVREIPQCANLKWSGDHPILQTITQGVEKADVLLEGDHKLKAVTITASGNKTNPATQRFMVCSTYALVRALQPDYFSGQQALDSAVDAWKRAAGAPAPLAIIFDKIVVQYVPFMLKLTPAG